MNPSERRPPVTLAPGVGTESACEEEHGLLVARGPSRAADAKLRRIECLGKKTLTADVKFLVRLFTLAKDGPC